MQAEIMRFEDMKFTKEHCDLYKENEWLKASLQQAVKDTAKEIIAFLTKDGWGGLDYLEVYTDDIKEIEKRYIVEVE